MKIERSMNPILIPSPLKRNDARAEEVGVRWSQ